MQKDLPRSLRIASVWVLIGTLLFLAVQWWQHESQRASFALRGDVVELQRGRDGHYHWPGSVNGRAVDFLVDTGATRTAISTDLARALDLQARRRVQSSTAGGTVVGEEVVADLSLQGGVQVERLRVIALPALGERPLLGMDVLGRLHWRQVDGVLHIDLRQQR